MLSIGGHPTESPALNESYGIVFEHETLVWRHAVEYASKDEDMLMKTNPLML